MKLEASIHKLEVAEKKFKAIGVIEGYVDPAIIGNLAKYSTNQSVIYRHVHPSSIGEGEIFGNITSASVQDVDVKGISKKGIVLEGELMDYTESQRNMIELLHLLEQKGEPMKISIGFQEFLKNGKPIDGRPFEYSFTPYPVCKECEAKTMVNEDERIKELENLLNQAKVREDDLKSKVSKFESENAKLKETNSKVLEDKIAEVVSKATKEYEVRIDKLTKSLELAEKAPVLAELSQFEDDADVLEFYKTLPKEKLVEKLELKKKKTPPKIVTQTMEESKAVAKEEQTEIRKKVFEMLARDPDVNEALYGKVPDNKRFTMGA